MKSVRVRMYRQGLGDCFLLSFPRHDGHAHVLIDCGVLQGTDPGSQKIKQVAESIVEETGGRLDALVVTHQHWDHVSGFIDAEAIFSRLEVAEVWLAWTEDPTDDLASELANRKKKALSAINSAAGQLARSLNSDAVQTAHRLNGLLEFHGELGVSGRRTTAKAMGWVKARQGAQVRYFKPNSEPIVIPGVDGLRVYVLGPPHDAKMLRKSDPSARSSEVYELAEINGSDMGFLAAAEAMQTESAVSALPFNEWFRIPEDAAWDDDFFGEHYGFDGEGGDDWRRIENDWLGIAGRLALQLDSHTNNTSLALAFELSPAGRVLLFPGDAQVGNWLSWAPLEWKVKEGSDIRTVNTPDLLARTVLYKVGHHGSHNATLREQGLELMSSQELTAMLPVNRATAKKMGWKMPFSTLHKRLLEKTRGRILDLEYGLTESPPVGCSAEEWSRFIDRTNVSAEWLDFRVDISRQS